MTENRPETIDSRSLLRDQYDGSNDDVYTSPEAVEKYAEEVYREGLFDGEELVLDKYFLDEGATVLDLGCGAGRTTKPLAERGFDVVGVDKSEEMVAAAREIHTELDFRVGDATALSFPDESFDYVLFSNNGIDCIYPESKRTQALREVRRVLRPGGLFGSVRTTDCSSSPRCSRNSSSQGNYLSNGNRQRIGSPYKTDSDEFGLDIYWGLPWRTKAQIDDAGFELVEWITKRESPLKYFEKLHRYVAMKPGRR